MIYVLVCTVGTVTAYSVGTTHCVRVSAMIAKMIYFIVLFIIVSLKSQAGCICYVVGMY